MALCSSPRSKTGDVTPDSIILTQEGHWRLGGFFHSRHIRYSDGSAAPKFPEFSSEGTHNKYRRALLPDLNYLAPEYVLSKTSEAASDVFSLGQVRNSHQCGFTRVIEVLFG